MLPLLLLQAAAAAPTVPPRSVLTWVPGWAVGVDVGGLPYAAEARPFAGAVAGWRAPWGGRAAAVLHFSPRMPVLEVATIARHELRAEVGYRCAVLGLGVEWAEVLRGDSPRGELLYPTAYGGAELPLVVGPVLVTPRFGVGAVLAEVDLRHDGVDYLASSLRIEAGVRVELPVGGPG